MTEILEIGRNPHTPETFAHGAGVTALATELDLQLDRAAEIAMAIDPQHTLPDVELIPNPTRIQQIARGSLTDMDYVITYQGVKIGKSTLVTDKSAGERWFNGIEIDGAPRREGFGMATYKAAIVGSLAEGISFRTHGWTQSEGSKNVWDSLARRGAARIIEPFKRANDGKYLGHYVIDAIKT
jgi:hypothetical protein